MKLRRIKTAPRKYLIEPIDKKDLPLFRHCSHNCIAVTQSVFDNEVKEMLFAHGVGCLGFPDESDL